MPDQHHDHLICAKCGLILEFEDEEIERLQRKVARLEYKLETAELIIDVQKRVSLLLGIKLPTSEPDEPT